MQTETEIDFDAVYLLAPADKRELREMREENTLRLSSQAIEFCHQIVNLGRLPTDAYTRAVSVEEEVFDDVLQINVKQWVKPDHAAYHARVLLRNRDVLNYIDTLREEVKKYGMVEREEMIQALKTIALNPENKNTDRIQAAAQLNRMEGFNREPETPTAVANLTLILPFTPNKLISAPAPKIIDGEFENVV